ncbi:MAG TPA: GtrA family protein [Azospirillaceae bacterium]|nr:GtrA family protein [Azospirillaceae bacterium]
MAPRPGSKLTRSQLAIRYAAFAVVATALNLLAQMGVFAVYSGPYALYGALALGTLVGLVVKYVLDKHWIFHDRSTGLGTHARKFSLYTLFGLLTTVVFWGTELAFDALAGGYWRYVGGALGLAVGYMTKYRLDRRFVFGAAA